jgi:D-alanyl-D-alanine carboxypeptidase
LLFKKTKEIMKKIIVGLAFAVTILMGCKKSSDKIITDEYKYSEDSLPATYVNRLNSVFDSACAADDIKGVSAAIMIPNKGLWKRAYGFSHSGVPINTDMLFSIGSNTKTFTAVTILKLQERNLLNINDTIGKWFKSIPYINGKITIKQLLNHTSGMAYYDSSVAFRNAITGNFSKIWSDSEFYQFLRPAHFAPGTNFDYSNTNFVLLGFILNKVTGRPTKDVMKEIIFSPAGLTKTFYFPFEQAVGNVPHFWSNNISGNFEDITAIYNYSPNAYHSLGGGADGCILSTATDNIKFWYALFNNKLISKNSLELMQQFSPIVAMPDRDYGLGLFQYRNFNNRTLSGHAGGVIGGTNVNGYDYTGKVHISVHTNQDIVIPESVIASLHKVTVQFEK